jgi:hypothetical protein
MPLRPSRLLSVAAALVLCLAVAPTAFGAPVKAPRWLKKPYRHYTLTVRYGMDEEAAEDDSGASDCYASEETYRSSFTGHGSAEYRFLFGRWYNRKTRRYQAAFVWKRVSSATSAAGHASEHWTAPPGCPQQTTDMSCTWSTHLPKPKLTAAKETTSRFDIAVDAPDVGSEGGRADCSGPEPSTWYDFDLLNGVAQPSDVSVGATLRFTAAGVKADKSFGVPIHPGERTHGTLPDNYGGKASWTSALTTSGRVALVPAR